MTGNTTEAPLGPDPFEDLFIRELGYVCGALRRLGVHEADIEDVAQDLFFQVHRKMDSFDHTRALRPWLFGFAYRSALQYRRSARRRPLPLEGDLPDSPAESEEPGDQAARRALVSNALDRLDLERRAVLVAFEIDELPMKEIAANMGIPLNTAYSRLRLAREDFAKAVARVRSRGDA